MDPGRLVLPAWLAGLVSRSADFDARLFTRLTPPPHGEVRRAAVLVLFGDDGDGPDVLLLRRSDGLPDHPGQVAFPGGSIDPGDDGPVAAALREAGEEAGVRAGGVLPLTVLPELYLPPSNFLVTPVVAFWREPHEVAPVDPNETASVARVPLRAMADPANRFQVRVSGGWAVPAFSVSGLLVWGFTAGILSVLLSLTGWERPWNTEDVRDLDQVAIP